MGKVNELHITFIGVCVNVNGLAPGLPMRTVLPWAQDIRFNEILVPDPDGGSRPVFYYLFPHVAAVRDRLQGGRSWPLFGHHLKIVNAKPQPFCHERQGSFSLSEFKTGVRPNGEVVYEGRAAAYFDITRGRVWTEGGEYENKTTHVSIRTEGTPVLRITSLPGSHFPMEEHYSIDSGELYVTNLDVQSVTEDAPFDFLLNFLVTAGGIPTELDRITPGMYSGIGSIVTSRLGERIKAFGLLVETQGHVSEWKRAVRLGDEPSRGRIPPAGLGGTMGLGTLSALAVDPISLDPACSPGNLP